VITITKEYAQKVIVANAVCCSTTLNCIDDCPLRKECDTKKFCMDGNEIAEAVRTLKN
jgi:hypothetical protein